MTRRLAVLAGAIGMIAAAVAPASAQVIRTRPFPGLFGSGDPAKSVTQVDFLSFIAGGHENSTFSLADGRLGESKSDSTFGNLVFRGRLAHRGRRNNFGTNGAATTSYYDRTGDMSPFNLSFGANADGELGRYGHYSLRQTIYYSPYYVYGMPAADISDADTDPDPITNDDSDPTVDPRVDERVARLSTKGYHSFASASRRVGKDGTFFGTYRFAYIDYAPGVSDLVMHAPRGGYRKRISRFGSLMAGYGLHLYNYRDSGFSWLTSHDVALGYGYDRPLSAWRRTVVGFYVSTALVGDGATLRTYINGNARIYRRIGRTWITGLTYLRGQQVLEGFAVPFFTFSNAVSGTFSGRTVRDIQLSGHLTYSHNSYTIGALENEFDRIYASSRVQVPVMWALAAYVEGYYTDQDFQRRLGLLQGIPSRLERIGMRAGVTVSVPVYR